MFAARLKWLAVAGTLLLTAVFGWAVTSTQKPEGAALHPRVAGADQPSVHPASGPPQTLTYVS